ncbi:keratin, type II cytoskeletal 8-like [Pristis pectinata]|uniref:keratin, type II cytoskeletal 8-like n=1 Tax=Pristis pectinata TaxID=685728 RepID=UPI00223C90A3|nr:keratin, type II cytoskeletal 8-like [Pristis pectinata]
MSRYSSQSLQRMPTLRTVPRSFTNNTMLLPEEPRVEVDAQGRAVRNQEKEDIKGLNNRFSELIGQVRRLEQENQVLQTRWELLQQGDTYKSNADKIVNLFCSKLKQQLSDLERERDRLKMQITQTQRMVDEFKQKYEDEINTRTTLENEFVILKKEVDESYFQKVELESKLEYLTNLIEFLKLLYAEEIQELQSQIQSTAVTLTVKNNRQLDMRNVIEDMKRQHADITARNKAEAEAWYQNMLQDLENDKARQNDDLRNTKNEAAELNRVLQRLKSDIDGLQNQRASLESNVVEVEDRGQMAIKDAKNHINDLQEALRKVKTDLADQAREHQELLNATMALDMEIATYRKLLDGEEERDGIPTSGTVRMVNTVAGPRTSSTRSQLRIN